MGLPRILPLRLRSATIAVRLVLSGLASSGPAGIEERAEGLVRRRRSAVSRRRRRGGSAEDDGVMGVMGLLLWRMLSEAPRVGVCGSGGGGGSSGLEIVAEGFWAMVDSEGSRGAERVLWRVARGGAWRRDVGDEVDGRRPSSAQGLVVMGDGVEG